MEAPEELVDDLHSIVILAKQFASRFCWDPKDDPLAGFTIKMCVCQDRLFDGLSLNYKPEYTPAFMFVTMKTVAVGRCTFLHPDDAAIKG